MWQTVKSIGIVLSVRAKTSLFNSLNMNVSETFYAFQNTMHRIKLAKEAYELQQGHWEKVSMWVTLTYPKNNSYREMTH